MKTKNVLMLLALVTEPKDLHPGHAGYLVEKVRILQGFKHMTIDDIKMNFYRVLKEKYEKATREIIEE